MRPPCSDSVCQSFFPRINAVSYTLPSYYQMALDLTIRLCERARSGAWPWPWHCRQGCARFRRVPV